MSQLIDNETSRIKTLDLSYKTILSVAVPLMVSSFIQSIVLITDASFISRYSTLAFDAVGNGGLIYLTFFVALAGMNDGSQILIARRIGQQNENAIGRIFGTSVLTNLLLASILFLIIRFLLPDFIMGYTANEKIGIMQIEYIEIRGFALFFAMISLSIQAFFLSNGRTWIVMICAAITAISNIGLDALLIFGTKTFPAMGLQGAAWASTISDGIGMIALFLFLFFSKERKRFRLFAHFSFNLISMKELFKVGSPLMFQGILALGTWTFFFAWIEQRGTFELTVSQNIRAIYFLAFVPIWGFAGTTKTYISQYLGKGDHHSLKIIQRRIQLLTVLFLFIFFHGAILYPKTLISLINPAEEYLEKSAEIMRFITFSILIFGLSSVYFQTINGSGNTMATLTIEIVSVGVYIFSAYLLIKVFMVDVFWIWSVEYIYFSCMGLLSILFLRHFNWKKKVV